MATRSRIGILSEDGSVLSAYHHWDGGPNWLGRILKTHYNSRELATELIDGGSMSCCWTDERWDGNGDGSYGPNYYAYRGEDCPPRHDETLKEYLSNGEEYAYIYTQDDEWVCYDLHSDLPEQVEIPSPLLHVG